jgi:CheY-like chemotaxis protein
MSVTHHTENILQNLGQKERFGQVVAIAYDVFETMADHPWPATTCKEAIMSTKGTRPLTEFSSCGWRVLCVDDAEPALALRALILKTRGYAVTTSNDALQVAETFEKGKYDLAVLDYEMPAMNGCQLATLLKTACPELKIILYTGATYVARHDLPSIDAIVHKSDGLEELLAAIEAFLPSWQQNTNSGVRSSAPFA